MAKGPDLFAPERANSKGFDLTDAPTLERIEAARAAHATAPFSAGPILAAKGVPGKARPVLKAALSAYPELGCENKQYEAATKWCIFEDVFCPNEVTFKFLEDVIDEVVTLFPGKYIYVGGDECPKEAWKKSSFCQELIKKENLKDEHGLQSYFIQRMEKYINAKGKQIIGWDEILEGALAPNATVMSWRGIQGGMEAARQNHDVIMTPGTHCYFDHYQSDSADEPIAIGGLTPLEKVYGWTFADVEAVKTMIKMLEKLAVSMIAAQVISENHD